MDWNAGVSLRGLIHPRVEPEIAFVFRSRLEGTNITARDVWLATECIMPAVEIIDSRYDNFSFTLVDVIADNASSARFYLADQAFSPYQFQLDEVGVVMRLNGEVVQTGAGAAVLGHPVRSVIEQVRMLARIGKAIEPGMLVLTGGITEAIYVHPGDRVEIEFAGMGRWNSMSSSEEELRMPLVQVTMVEGRSPEQKRALIEKLTDAVVVRSSAKRETVRVCSTRCQSRTGASAACRRRSGTRAEGGRNR